MIIQKEKTLTNVNILGSGICLPNNKVDNEKLGKLFSLNSEWIELFLGNKSRYYAYDFDRGAVNQTLTDLLEEASQKALIHSKIKLSEIDGLIVSTATPDNLMPTTANLLATRLGFHNIPTYQIQSGCCGAIQAIDLGAKLLLSKQHENLLIAGGDVCNKFFNSSIDFEKLDSNELINYALFGDGAGALVLSSDVHTDSLAIQYIINQFVGGKLEPGQIINWLGQAINSDNSEYKPVLEDYKTIEKNVPIMSNEILNKLLSINKTTLEDIDYYLPPQLSGNMTKSIIERLSIPENKAINIVSETGNNGNAVPFIQINRLLERITPGQKAICITIESSKWTKGGLLLYANA